jgi:hypothetical protein
MIDLKLISYEREGQLRALHEAMTRVESELETCSLHNKPKIKSSLAYDVVLGCDVGESNPAQLLGRQLC